MGGENTMGKSLMDCFAEIPDVRRSQGLMHDLSFCLTLIVLGLMSGYKGVRGLGDFVKGNKDEIINYFRPKKSRVPSYSTIRRVMLAVNFDDLTKAFYLWAMQNMELKEEDAYAVDGKCIRSTVTDSNDSEQNYLSIVSAFGQTCKQVLAQTKFYSKKESEISKVLEILEMVEVEGKTFTLDALHCQKKQ